MNSRIAFTGGGTAGHVFPGLAVLRSLEEAPEGRGPLECFWIGSSGGMERQILGEAGIPYYGIPAGKLRRYLSLQNFTDLFKVVAGILSSLAILIQRRPALLFSKGGFVSVPPVLAAWILRIPVMIHESDVDPGLATRITARFARRILVSYEETRNCFAPPLGERVAVTGNPVRREIYLANREAGRRALGLADDQLLLMVLGGSQGALQINKLIAELAPQLVKRCQILHQMGKQTYRASSVEGYDTRKFIGAELPDYLAAADVVVSRAGAGSLWELAALRKPMILIPLGRENSRGDQIRNAELFQTRGSAETLTGEVTPQRLMQTLNRLLEDPARRRALSGACETLAQRRGDRAVAELIWAELAQQGPS